MKKLIEGSVWFYAGSTYKNKETDVPVDRTICFDRPCVILSIQGSAATIIPMTSKHSKFYVSYPIQIQEGIMSHAVISQVKTVDIRTLKYFIGLLKKDVFTDLKAAFYSLIDNKKVVRNAPQRFNKLDISRFYPFHIYEVEVKDRTELFMVIQDKSFEFYEIPIRTLYEDPKKRLRNSVKTICGILDFANMHPLSNKRYYQSITDIGMEYRQDVRYEIAFAAQEKNTYNIAARELRYSDNMERISKAVYMHFGILAYRQGMHMINELCNNPEAQDMIFNKPWRLLNLKQNRNKIDENLTDIRTYILNHLNPMYCSLHCLNILDNSNKGLLDNLIEPCIGVFNLHPTKRTSKIFDGSKIHGRYNVSCMNWLYDYIKKFNLSDKLS